jgi:hypothetical protein
MRYCRFFIALCIGLLTFQQADAQWRRVERPRQGQRQGRQVVKQMNLQLYSIRDILGNAETYAKNHAEVFQRLHEMGYTGV